MRFKEKFFPEYQNSWCVVDTLNHDEPIFGDRLPSDKETCQQQARAANIAANIILSDLINTVLPNLDKKLNQLKP
jgi:hypothetical protein